jgi:integrase
VTEPKKKKRERGTGRIYQPKQSKFLWIQYYRDGKMLRESTHSTKHAVAEKLLRTRLAEIDAGIFSGPQVRRVKVIDLYMAFLDNYRITGKKAIKWAETNWDRHLEAHFGVLRASEVTSDVITAYIAKRQTEGAANATINRELACLRRAFYLGYEATPRKVSFVPHFEHLDENPPRKGFVDDAQYERLVKQNPPLWLRTMLALGYNFGFRKGELLKMRVGQIDLLNQTITLYRGTTKSGEPRLLSFAGLKDVEALLRECVRDKGSDHALLTRPNGQRIVNPLINWRILSVQAGLGEFRCPRCHAVIPVTMRCEACDKRWQGVQVRYNGLLFHDLRRSAIRNLVRAGVNEQVAMTMSGHKSRAVFERYNIVSETDLRAAVHKLAASRVAYAQNEHRTSTGNEEKDSLTRRGKEQVS